MIDTVSIYNKLIVRGEPELSNEEAKRYFLTTESFRVHRDRIVLTIAGIANTGLEGAIVFRGPEQLPEPVLDGAVLDDAIRRVVHPRVDAFVLTQTIEGQRVDFIRVPESNRRPHIISLNDGRFAVPIRGVANNIAAARAELDEMYHAQHLAFIRSIVPDAENPMTSELHQTVKHVGIGWRSEGFFRQSAPAHIDLLAEAESNQFVTARRARELYETISAQDRASYPYELFVDVIASGGHRGYNLLDVRDQDGETVYAINEAGSDTLRYLRQNLLAPSPGQSWDDFYELNRLVNENIQRRYPSGRNL
jgi:hypothetical protein